MTSPHPSLTWSQWSTTVTVVTRGDDLERVVAAVRTELAAVDTSCNRFRPDSELSVINASATGQPVAVSPVLQCYLQSALAMAEATDGLVDPTLGATLRRLGYDADIDEVRRAPRRVTPTMVAATKGTWRDVELLERDDEPGAWLRLPAGLELDLGATAKALAADRSAAAGHAVSGQAVLVSLGGDLAMAGSGSEPWLVDVSETAHPMDDGHSSPDQVVVGDGGIATSTTLARRWLTARGTAHHLVDPSTGLPAAEYWRTATVAAESCLQANAASAAAVIRGRGAAGWLTDLGLPARLVRHDGVVLTTAGWPGSRVPQEVSR